MEDRQTTARNWFQSFCITKSKSRFKSISEKKRKLSSSIICTPRSKPYVSGRNQRRDFFFSCDLLFCWLSSELACSSAWAVRGTMWQFQVLEQLYTSARTLALGYCRVGQEGKPSRKALSRLARANASVSQPNYSGAP